MSNISLYPANLAPDTGLPLGVEAPEATLAHLQARVLELERVAAELTDACVAADARNAQLASLLTVHNLLMGCDNRSELMCTLEEIITDLLGSEDFSILEAVGLGDRFEVVLTRQSRPFNAQEGTAQRGDPILSIPMVYRGAGYAMLQIYALLPHKSGVDELDRELIEVLRMQGGSAFARTARRHARGTAS